MIQIIRDSHDTNMEYNKDFIKHDLTINSFEDERIKECENICQNFVEYQEYTKHIVNNINQVVKKILPVSFMSAANCKIKGACKIFFVCDCC